MTNKIRKIEKIPIKDLHDFPEHPFEVKDDDSMQFLAESAKEFGILTPISVRPSENGGYEIISGHRRKRACELAGINEIPAVVTECTRDEAIIMMTLTYEEPQNTIVVDYADTYTDIPTTGSDKVVAIGAFAAVCSALIGLIVSKKHNH